MIGRTPVELLDDILAEAVHAAGFVAGYTFDSFRAVRRTWYAVVRSLEIIGEASNRLPQGTRGRAADIPWRDVVGMRHRLAHDYIHVDLGIVWSAVLNDLPVLVSPVRRLWDELVAEEPPPPEPA